MTERRIWAYNFTGWVLFTISALFFLWGTWTAGDVIGIIASLAFLIACLVFMIPAWVMRPRRSNDT